MADSYVSGEGTTWPHPDRVGEVEWRLRYLPPAALTRGDMLVAASVCAVYRRLAEGVHPRKALARLRRLVRAARAGEAVELEQAAERLRRWGLCDTGIRNETAGETAGTSERSVGASPQVRGIVEAGDRARTGDIQLGKVAPDPGKPTVSPETQGRRRAGSRTETHGAAPEPPAKPPADRGGSAP